MSVRKVDGSMEPSTFFLALFKKVCYLLGVGEKNTTKRKKYYK
jgi:hypothetical protein